MTFNNIPEIAWGQENQALVKEGMEMYRFCKLKNTEWSSSAGYIIRFGREQRIAFYSTKWSLPSDFPEGTEYYIGLLVSW